ncbi:unnamed protein product (macronuclear) [Paramecium tetraurelia]|uniref:Uncharacterized protein n=1 Tax=Paramecium tetraurelia TaxID=5888 RepID=A0CLY7_PARTE|nr:uncharacterized protein GSPATT00008283001 [Paramecium tetraurelia]CAK71804.1 unnamed protein product [Paramecium tetraurelia]|eukprot:XP_001439201.1 hypothetical protein (macronuclear) [Paramecium tetraurelia strain d4-2]
MIKQLFKLGTNVCGQRIGKNLKLFNYYQRFYFTTGTQSIDQLKTKLAELNSKFYEIEEYKQKEKIMLDVIDVKKQINTLLFPNKQEENKFYEGYRRDLLVLAQLNFENDKREDCSKLLNEIMQGDFRNEFKDHKDENQAFLTGLFMIHCMSNLDKLSIAEQSAGEAVQYLQYFIDNQCPIYQASIQNQTPNSENLFEQELQHIQNMVTHLSLYSKICQERGKFSESIDQLGIAATLLDNTGHLFRKIFSKQITVKTELSDDDLKRHFMNILINEAIILKNLAKSCLHLGRFEDGKQLIDASLTYFDYLIEQKLLSPNDENYVATLIELYNYLYQKNEKLEEMNAIKNKLDDIAKNTKENENTLYTLIRYELFLNKYYSTNLQKLIELMAKIKQDVPMQIEFNQQLIQALIGKGDNKAAQEYCLAQLNILKSYFDSSHQQYGETLVTLLELAINEQDFLSAKDYIVQLSSESHNITYISDIEQIIKFQRLRTEFLERLNQQQPIEQLRKTLDKIESIAFTKFSRQYKKSTVLADFYEKIGDKNLQKEKLQECLNVLQQNGTFPNSESLIKSIKKSISEIQ